MYVPFKGNLTFVFAKIISQFGFLIIDQKQKKILNNPCISFLLGIRLTLDHCKNPEETRITKLQGFIKLINIPLNHIYGKALTNRVGKCIFKIFQLLSTFSLKNNAMASSAYFSS